ncbi:MAG: hypothetical protein KY468_21290 [Armatimonadetes bacterium]|nr:hypothetical protein [Armatimonadota bacterium]
MPALLFFPLHSGCRAWSGFDGVAMDRLHEKGFIENPRNKSKLVILIETGLE